MAQLKTSDDWWAEVDRRATNVGRTGTSDLEELIFGDVGCPIDASCKELIEQEKLFGRGIKLIQIGLEGREEMQFKDALWDMIAKRDTKLWNIFQSIWFDAPDKPYIHQWTMWGAFCDLCSEGMTLLFETATPYTD